MSLKSFEDMRNSSVFFLLKPAEGIYAFLVVLCMLLFAMIVWAVFAPMDEVVKASVQLRPQSAISSVLMVSSGEVSEKHFDNDSQVNDGDLLFKLDTSAYEKQRDYYSAQLQKITGDIFVNNTLLDVIASDEFPDLPYDSAAYVKSAAYLYEKRRYETVVKDYFTKLERERDLPSALKIPQNLIDIQNLYEQNLLAFETWKNAQISSALETKNQLEASYKSLESSLTELERAIKNATIYAPISGRISEVRKLNEGDYVLAGEEIVRIIPDDSEELKAELFVDGAYIAKVDVGNPVRIKFPGLPPSRFGQIQTRISLIPPDAASFEGNVVFVAEADIQEPYLIAKNGNRAKLIPGITAEARIVTDRSTVLRMVLKRLDFIN